MINQVELEQFCRELVISQSDNDLAHQIDHIERVVKTAKQIATAENADLAVVTAAAFCHDLVNYAKNSSKRALSSRHAAEKTIKFLKLANYPEGFCQAVFHAIEAHSFSAEVKTQSIEAKVVQDADRIDALGAIGIARCILVGSSFERQLYSESDPFCQQRAPDDLAYTLDHFYQKLFKLPAKMQTTTGRNIAEQRVEFMKKFLIQLDREIS